MNASQEVGFYNLVGVLIFVIGLLFWMAILYLIIRAAVYHAMMDTIGSAQFRSMIRSGRNTATGNESQWPAIR